MKFADKYPDAEFWAAVAGQPYRVERGLWVLPPDRLPRSCDVHPDGNRRCGKPTRFFRRKYVGGRFVNDFGSCVCSEECAFVLLKHLAERRQ